MFSKATKKKLRFSSVVGLLTIEDLWDLPLESNNGPSLNSIAKNINKTIKEEEEESFVGPSTNSNSNLNLRFNIVKYIIAEKIEDRNKTRHAVERKDKKNRIMEILASKQDEDLQNKSAEELTELLEDY